MTGWAGKCVELRLPGAAAGDGRVRGTGWRRPTATTTGERLTEITQRRTGNQELVSQFLYGDDEASNRTAVTETLRLPDATLTHHRGAASATTASQRLTGGSNTPDGWAFSYGYDAVGNRLAATRTLTGTQTHSYSYDDANRLVTADGVAYTYDAAGNRLSQIRDRTPSPTATTSATA